MFHPACRARRPKAAQPGPRNAENGCPGPLRTEPFRAHDFAGTSPDEHRWGADPGETSETMRQSGCLNVSLVSPVSLGGRGGGREFVSMSRLSLLSVWGAGVVEGSLSQCLACLSCLSGGPGWWKGVCLNVSLVSVVCLGGRGGGREFVSMSRLSLLSLWGAGVVEGSLSQCLACLCCLSGGPGWWKGVCLSVPLVSVVSLGWRAGTGGYFAAVSLIDSWIH